MSDNGRRRFGRRERVALYLAADGHCAVCGTTLPAGWHADHITPYARGGATDVLNGQALCPDCNLKKGTRVIVEDCLSSGKRFRRWQENGLRIYHEEERTDFLVSATPGAGKTTFALEIARRALASGRVRRIVVVVPTTHLRTQWCDAAHDVGISLDPAFVNRAKDGEVSDFVGCCVTYAQVASFPEIHRNLCRVPTMVIFDEIHHAGRMRSWGVALREAFEPATERICLTGTPFREDGHPIPFVRYDPETDKCLVDVPYSYGDALRDGDVRNIVFPSFEGTMTWWSGDAEGSDENGKEWSASFADDLPLKEEPRRTRTALDPRGEWMRDVLRQADAKLMDTRRTIFPAAGGLVVAIDQHHAHEIARTMREVIDVDPAVALSDDPGASKVITAFGKGKAHDPRWLIAVKMVSEGVDIPRLFVGVWATNTKTNLFFRQVVGRFVRMIPGVEDQTGYLFIPKLPYLVGFVETIKQERDVSLMATDEEMDERDDDDRDHIDDRWPPPSASPNWAPYGSTAIEDVTYIGDESFTISEMASVRAFIVGTGLEGANVEATALILRRYRAWHQATDPAPQPAPVPPAPPKVHEQREQLRRKVRNLVSRYIQLHTDTIGEIDRRAIYGNLMRLQGVAQENATLAQLKERVTLVTGWIDDIALVRR